MLSVLVHGESESGDRGNLLVITIDMGPQLQLETVHCAARQACLLQFTIYLQRN